MKKLLAILLALTLCVAMAFSLASCDILNPKPEDVETHTHTMNEAVRENEVASTCTKNGSYDVVVYCTDCDYEFNREKKTVTSTGHSYKNFTCTKCAGKAIPSEGLKFTSNGDGTCYVAGIGACTDANVVIPLTSPAGDKVTSIGKSAFSHIKTITGVLIPDSVKSVGEKAFWNCKGLKNIEVDVNNKTYKSESGNLYSLDGKTLIQYAIGNTNSSFIIPNSVTSIGDFAFSYCKGLKDIVIGNGVKSIGDGAFSYCESIKNIQIPNSVTSIGKSAFSDCKGLTSVSIGNGVKSIGEEAFWSCSALKTIVLGDGVKSIGDFAFSSCHSLASVYYKGSATEFISINVGYGGGHLTSSNRYYYSYINPSKDGKFWHYNTEGKVVIWEYNS